MNSQLTWSRVEGRHSEAVRTAEIARPSDPADRRVEPARTPRWRTLVRRKEVPGRARRRAGAPGASGITIRYAFPDDAKALVRLAALDSRPVPEGPLLLAEVEGELWAALALTGPAALSDPFRPSAELLLLLAERSRQLRGTAVRRRGSRRPGVARRWRTS